MDEINAFMTKGNALKVHLQIEKLQVFNDIQIIFWKHLNMECILISLVVFLFFFSPKTGIFKHKQCLLEER